MAYRRTELMQRRVQKRRKQILRAAEHLIEKNGYEKTTMQEIARKAGTSIGNVYFYFENKETLMLAIMEQLNDEIWKRHPASAELQKHYSPLVLEALDDYLKIATVFRRKALSRIILSGDRCGRFRNYVVKFLIRKAEERYSEYEDFFEGVDHDLALNYHFGGVVHMMETILDGTLERTAHETGMFLAKSKLHIRGLAPETVRRTLEELNEIIESGILNTADP